jgi:hypothetical protein
MVDSRAMRSDFFRNSIVRISRWCRHQKVLRLMEKANRFVELIGGALLNKF